MPNRPARPAAPEVPPINAPKGGGAIKGLGETFAPDAFSGAGGYAIPLSLTEARGGAPQLSLSYQSGAGNSPFGMGFSLPLGRISRRTERGVPRYEAGDIFIDGGDELVRTGAHQSGVWRVDDYRPRVEAEYAQIQHWSNPRTGQSYWQVITLDNTRITYGQSADAQIADPDDPTRVYAWLIEQSLDARGNITAYSYLPEDDANVPDVPWESDRALSNKYIASIQYGNYLLADDLVFAFQVVFDYGQYDLQNLANGVGDPHTPSAQGWDYRPDPFSSYRSGFEIRTRRRCKTILLFHDFKDALGDPCLVKFWALAYADEASPAMENPAGLSFLRTVTETGCRRQALSATAPYDLRSLPPVTLGFSGFQPPEFPTFQLLTMGGDGQTADEIPAAAFQPVDMDGEGIAGLLAGGADGVWYMAPRGGGRYAPSRPMASFPIDRFLNDGRTALRDLDGDGALDLTVTAGARTGFYPRHDDGSWGLYTPFAAYPNDHDAAAMEAVSLSANGKTDALVVERDDLLLYESLGRSGYAPAARRVKPQGFPAQKPDDAYERVTFGDPFGDGLSHRIKVANGRFECWPDLGYGRFGDRVLINDAPVFGEDFDIDRLHLADIDGSGVLDLIYVYPDRVLLFINRSGNGFAPPITVALPETCTDLDRIGFADILGNGTTCLTFTKVGPAPRHYFYSFVGETATARGPRRVLKPYLLTDVANSLGAATHIQYASSTQFYLADQAAGRPWRTKLRFPVQVVEAVISTEAITGARYEQSFAYHDGFYDTVEKEFRGFGYVESWDTETLSADLDLTALDLSPGGQAESGPYTPPVYTRSWYHTGVFDQDGAVLAAYRRDYFSGDPQAYDMPASVLPTGSAETVRQAHVALKGHVLRQEVYGLDGSDQAAVPYTVEESNFDVSVIQPIGESSPYAVFAVRPREDMVYHYEREASDPRIAHDFKFAFDDWGNLLKGCTLSYPRRVPQIAAQGGLAAIGQVDQMAAPIDGSYLRAEPSDSQSFELGNLTSPDPALYFDFDVLLAQFETALVNIIPPEQAFSGSTPQARRLSWGRTIYSARGQALPLGEVSSPALVHHVTEAVLSPGQVAAVYGAKLTPATLDAAGYVPVSGYWWNPGSIAAYAGADQYHLPLSTTDPFGTVRSVAYDPYDLRVVSATDPDGTTRAVYDYDVLEPWRVTDVNDIVTEALFDPLGQVVVSTVYHLRGEGDAPVSRYVPPATAASTSTVIADPAAYLQSQTSFFFYDLVCWSGDAPQPPHVVSVSRTIHVSDLASAGAPPPIVSIAYFDGLGRSLQARMRVDGSVNGTSDPIWLTTGEVIRDNKGQVARAYRPTFQGGYLYGVDTTTPYDSFFHDALGRPFRTLTAKGFYTQTDHAAWSQTAWDADDTILNSPYYLANIDNADPDFADELDALRKAAVFANTPTTSCLDPMGHVVEVQQINVSGITPTPLILKTVNTVDIEGNVLTVADPRFAAANAAGGGPIYNFVTVYDMHGGAIGVTGVDCGARQSFTDVLGRLTDSWDARGVHVQRGYDSMSRLTSAQVTGLGMTSQQVERYAYGVDPALNQVGRLISQEDEAGRLALAGYNLEGRATQQSRQVRQDYKNEVDWAGAGPPLDPPLTLSALYDIGGAALRETLPDGAVVTRSYFSTGWSDAVTVILPEAAASEVTSTQYNAEGQPVVTRHGNGVTTVRGYEPSTGDLLSIVTTRASDGTTLQRIGYTRDAVGNVTRVEDASIADVFVGQAQVTPLRDYTYDALYRLIRATGRENPAITQTSYQTGWKQSAYMPLGPSPNDTKLAPYVETYVYDESGNMTSLAHTSTQSPYGWTRVMTPSATSNRTVPSNLVTPATPPDSFFDANGNLTSLSTLRALSWSFRDAPASATLIARAANDNDDAEWYLYDAGGQRVRKVTQRLTAGGVTLQDKVYLGGYEVSRGFNGGDLDGAPLSERHTVLVDGGAQRALVLHRWISVTNGAPPPPQFRHQYGGEQESCALELDGDGLILSYEEYFPYGGTAILAGGSQVEVGLKVHRYSGKERDDSTGLYYYGARYYAPWLGRWTSCDPAGTVDGPNLYAFVGGNPVTYVDVGGRARLQAYHYAYRGDGDILQQAINKNRITIDKGISPHLVPPIIAANNNAYEELISLASTFPTYIDMQREKHMRSARKQYEEKPAYTDLPAMKADINRRMDLYWRAFQCTHILPPSKIEDLEPATTRLNILGHGRAGSKNLSALRGGKNFSLSDVARSLSENKLNKEYVNFRMHSCNSADVEERGFYVDNPPTESRFGFSLAPAQYFVNSLAKCGFISARVRGYQGLGTYGIYNDSHMRSLTDPNNKKHRPDHKRKSKNASHDFTAYPPPCFS